MTDILIDPSSIVGHIYLITNTVNGKLYVGQTLSHRKNHGKYRPFGYEGRFKDHISEAICNTKKKQCTYLNNGIRHYGKDAFTVSLLYTCKPSELDLAEQTYIESYNSLYPNGYNLTRGGKVFKHIETDDISPTTLSPPKKRGGCTVRSQETREKMSKSLKAFMADDNTRKLRMERTQRQHADAKYELFNGVKIDMTNLEQYIRTKTSKVSGKFVVVKIGDIKTSFTGKYESVDILKTRAIEFLKQVNLFATLPNCSGNP
jgi:hypothetical protein